MTTPAKQFWRRYRDLEARLTNLRDRLATIEGVESDQWADPRTTRGQVQSAFIPLYIASNAANADALGDAYDALSIAQEIYNTAFTRFVLPDMGAAEDRRGGGSARGEQQRSAKQIKVDRCQSIAGNLWSDVPESRKPFSVLRYKKELAPKIREQYRRDGYGVPPSVKWIKENIAHPKEKNPRS